MSYNKEYYQKYRKKNKEKIALKNKLWRQHNPDKLKKIRQRQDESGYTDKFQRQYRKTANSKYSSLCSRAKKRGIDFLIEKVSFIAWFNKQSKKCIYCNIPVTIGIKENRKTWLAIDRKDNGLPYIMGNIVISCYRCNILKSNDISFNTMLKIGKILKNAREV